MEPVILISGATRGIGFAAAAQLAARGARVIIGSRDLQRAKAAASSIGTDTFAIQLDITSAASVAAALHTIEQRHSHLDVLVNNGAVILDHYEDLMLLSPELLSETFATNVVGTLRLTQAMQPLLARSIMPRIINVSSSAGQLNGEIHAWAPAYCVSKTALNMLTQQLSAALPTMMINSMCPGWCRTEMGGIDAPLTAEEGADTLVWLALDAPGSLRGQFIKQREVIAW